MTKIAMCMKVVTNLMMTMAVAIGEEAVTGDEATGSEN